MSKNIIKLTKGSVLIEKEKVDKKRQSVKERDIENRLLSESMGLGMTIALPIAGGALIGAGLDTMLGTAPKLTLGLLFFGTFIGIVKMIRLVQTGEKTK